jgi:uncharacterized membrane protein YhaH (DUF805 family)
MLLIATSTINPISLAVSLMAASIIITPYLYKTLTRSWIPLVIILTFSSGMITLFIYTASLAANETNKTKKKMYPLLLVIIAPPMFMQKKTQESIKSFSSYTAIMILARILMVTLVAITTQAHNPNQTLSSSF